MDALNILVIHPAFIGDAVISLALAEAVKSCSPETTITYLVRPESVGLISHCPSVDTVIPFDKYGNDSGSKGLNALAEQLNALDFDVVFCLHSSERSLRLVEAIRAPRKVGIAHLRHIFTHIPNVREGEDQVEIATSFAQAIFPEADGSSLPRLDLADVVLPDALHGATRPLVGIAPGSVWKTKRWTAESYIELIAKCSAKSISTVLLGIEKDIDVGIWESANHLGNSTINTISQLSLEETAAVISQCAVLVSNDSAPVHIAVAVRTPVVDIFGPTLPSFGFAPRPDSGIVIQADNVWCRPCTAHGPNECPVHTMECMKAVSSARVFAAVEELLLSKANQPVVK